MEAVYASMDVNVTALFSVLYPPSIHVMLQPLAEVQLLQLLYYWHPATGRLGVRHGGGGIGRAESRAPRWVLPWRSSVPSYAFRCSLMFEAWAGQTSASPASVWRWEPWQEAGRHPQARRCGRCGRQAGPCGAGLAAALGSPLAGARCRDRLRRGRGGLTLAHVPLGRVLDNLASTLAFQQTVEPHWLHERSLPDWGRFLAFLRRPALLMLSLGLTAMAVWSNRSDVDRRREVSAVGMGLLATALAADSAGVGAYYATMAIPGWLCSSRGRSPLASRLVGGCTRGGMVLWLTDGGLIYNTPDVGWCAGLHRDVGRHRPPHDSALPAVDGPHADRRRPRRRRRAHAREHLDLESAVRWAQDHAGCGAGVTHDA